MSAKFDELLARLERLTVKVDEVRKGLRETIGIAEMAPDMAVTKARKVLEYIVRDVYQRRLAEPPGTRPLENLLQRLVRDGFFPVRLDAYANTVRKLGNVGTHTFDEPVTPDDVYQSLTHLVPILEWYFEVERGPDTGEPADAVEPTPPRADTAAARPGRIAIVPKGLRSFDARDSEFFLQLLPGPFDKDGLPESLRFWKHRIEARDELTFTVGLLYGPSGCGKSSLVKAGLLPRLSPAVIPVYVEATGSETELRLLNGLRKHCPELPAEAGLLDALTALGRGQMLPADRKLLIVLDQFEQWLHNRSGQPSSVLPAALRQCDGVHVQCLVTVRDDFWLQVSRFMGELGIEILQGQNTALVDLFDPLHARHVLAEFGRAYGRLPDDLDQLPPDQAAFLSQAIDQLSEGGKVISVRLSLFAEMVKGREWVPATLDAVGGVEGLGVTFLEETFCSPTANPKHRLHQQATRQVLKTLLPETGSNINGNLRSHRELLDASGYAERPEDFEALLRVLNGEVRLLTPTDPEGVERAGAEPSSPAGDDKYYQLTHDYLVPSLREWLTRKQRETRRGRAELRLEERTLQWTRSSEPRFLPGPVEYLSILRYVRRGKLADAQRAMLRAADRHYLGWTAVVVLALSLLASGAGWQWDSTQEQRTVAKLERFLDAGPQALAYALDDLRPFQRRAVPKLARVLADSKSTALHRLNAALALADFGDSRVEALIDGVVLGTPGLCPNLVRALEPVKADALRGLERRFGTCQQPDERARLATVALHLGEPKLAGQMLALARDPTDRTAFVSGFARWHDDPASLAKFLNIEDGAFRSGLLAAVALVPWDEMDKAERGKFLAAVSRLCREAPDGASHSAAVCALTKWQQQLPILERTRGRPPGRDWFVNSVGLTMIQIHAGELIRYDEGDQETNDTESCKITVGEFFLSDREITKELFNQFSDETREDAKAADAEHRRSDSDRGATTSDCPADRVDEDDAIRFCNWLSQKESLVSCYKLRVRKEGDDVNVSPDDWDCVYNSDGYRLPTQTKWEYACRAGTTTRFASGNDERALSEFAWIAPNARGRSWPAGQKLPNA